MRKKKCTILCFYILSWRKKKKKKQTNFKRHFFFQYKACIYAKGYMWVTYKCGNNITEDYVEEIRLARCLWMPHWAPWMNIILIHPKKQSLNYAIESVSIHIACRGTTQSASARKPQQSEFLSKEASSYCCTSVQWLMGNWACINFIALTCSLEDHSKE